MPAITSGDAALAAAEDPEEGDDSGGAVQKAPLVSKKVQPNEWREKLALAT